MTKTESVKVFHHAVNGIYMLCRYARCIKRRQKVWLFFVSLISIGLLFVNVCVSSNTRLTTDIWKKIVDWNLRHHHVFVSIVGFHRKYACHTCNHRNWFSKMIVSFTAGEKKKIHFRSLRRNIINICRLGSHAEAQKLVFKM